MLAEIFFSFHHFHHLAGLMYVYYCQRLLSYLFVVMKCRYIVKPKAIYGLGAYLIRSRAKRLTVMMGGHIWGYDTRRQHYWRLVGRGKEFIKHIGTKTCIC